MNTRKTRENSVDVQAALQKIGSLIAGILPPGWKKVVYGFFLTGGERTTHQQIWVVLGGDDDYTNLMQSYWDDDDFLDTMEALSEACDAFQKLCADACDPWSEMSLSLFPDGRFTVDFDYDEIRDFSSHFVMEWQSRFLD